MSREQAVAAIDYIRSNDCDFLTVENVAAYGHCDEAEAREALRDVMGEDWLRRMSA